jgi:hypothetical protein
MQKEANQMLTLEMIGLLGGSLALLTCAMVLSQFRRRGLTALRTTDPTATT